MKAKYDRIGEGYNATRKADPYLFSRLLTHLNPDPDGRYLDVGCGTGNYTKEFDKRGFAFTGMDPSRQMLDEAKNGENEVQWVQGSADSLPFADAFFDGVVATLTLHHWGDLRPGFQEVYRVLKPGTKWVIFTSDPVQMSHYWLCHYFPELMRKGIEQMPKIKTITQTLTEVGFTGITSELYSVQEDLQDLFLYSGKHQPERYFDKDLRRGISTFSDLANASEVSAGLAQLRKDIDSGKIEEVIREWEYDGGDYIYLIANKE
ncbi:class I SAM-dependent methyltransferase [Aureisphaera galaxeae]|uniref:class I SAM-dependent methyltransferase n=1 Tax=Aureisphaera galaxeae TaxID=1538023 RepID=UPI0023501846|nr:class I SAM-dependent methyltransferase [Aureisphaera galaxeae]MDC8002875.1 class I SAM-dependent methyltransferase [Aureisphaera galaxeae]